MNALEEIIREIIARQGDLSLAAFMELALQHPDHGYYCMREPIGKKGDFVTAPEISQMFGEMIGIWCVETWRELGKPNPFALVELGPGHGTMMQDILRATAHVREFQAARNLYLVESNSLLRFKQREKLNGADTHYVKSISDIPSMPTLILANEFFDALPIRQFEKTFRGWSERMVTVKDDGLITILRPLEEIENNLIPLPTKEAAPQTVVEYCPKAQSLMHDLACHVKKHKGALLIIDYGYAAYSGMPTLQALSHHRQVSILESPGEVDLTAHVDFLTLAQSADKAGLKVEPLMTQGEFLKNIGIEIRADSLKRHATPAQIDEIDISLQRLTGESQMGVLFKVMEARG